MLIQNGYCVQSNDCYRDPLQVEAGMADSYSGGEFGPSVTNMVPTGYFPCPTQTHECGCPTIPAKQSLLCQILTGHGYRNDILCFGQMVKLEMLQDFPLQSCCYSNYAMSDPFNSYMPRY